MSKFKGFWIECIDDNGQPFLSPISVEDAQEMASNILQIQEVPAMQPF